MSDTQVEPVAEYADMLQVGSRSMSNWALLAAVAGRANQCS
jgi:3-deoxy-D-arabino-heptulosonate 7-phosphate (DAHP) synthase